MTKEKTVKQELDKFHEIELEKLYEALLSTKNLQLQMSSFFGTATLAVMSVAFSSQKAGLFVFAALLIWALVVLNSRARRFVVAYYYRILQMSRKYSTDRDFYLNIIPGTEPNYARSLLNLGSQEKQLEGLKRIPLKDQSISAFWIPIMAGVIEILIGIMFWMFAGWSIY